MNFLTIETADKLGHGYWSGDAYAEMLERDQQAEYGIYDEYEEKEEDFSGATYLEGTNNER
jgi:hypothetical protein